MLNLAITHLSLAKFLILIKYQTNPCGNPECQEQVQLMQSRGKLARFIFNLNSWKKLVAYDTEFARLIQAFQTKVQLEGSEILHEIRTNLSTPTGFI